ncbi:PD-(D/E)XK motif protein [Saccharothrix coeruleofusca]|uniref:Uncharacterized protein n=1 Tax=Saccharothrix coeruleofusca TaxID=33919 RepID=A0A918AKS9_9PSEU|nr:PD-(D/E)XK motif protein [Saccharothrix coeruleofusca]GGP50255.1 hypothetical protein GCM10010185_23060 [Saccharothrix coeruleofusca]
MTGFSPIDKRHVSSENFGRILDSRVPVVLPITGTPTTFVFIEPRLPELGLRIATTSDDEAPDTGLRNIFARSTFRDGKRFFEVVITAPELFPDGYQILCAVADRVQLEHLPPARALRATLDRMSDLLRAPETLPREREVGLFGELLFLGGLINQLGAAQAIEAWRGNQSEEHDFGLPECDVEVKTTISESRTHWIESLTQLVPKVNRPLWLVSHQLTTAGVGAGSNLPDLIDAIYAAVDTGKHREEFENALSHTGWRDDYRDRLTTRWARRSASHGYYVHGAFPRLTPDNLRSRGVVLNRIHGIRYKIDLDGFEDGYELPQIIRIACAFEGWT